MKKSLLLVLALVIVFTSLMIPQMSYASSGVGSVYNKPVYYENATSRSWTEVYETYTITSKQSGVQLFQKHCMDSWIARGMTTQTYSVANYSSWNVSGNVTAEIAKVLKLQFGVAYSWGSTNTQTYTFTPNWNANKNARYANMDLYSVNNKITMKVTTKKIIKNISSSIKPQVLPTTTTTVTVYEPYATTIVPVYKSSL